jgi:hypothetical protein
LIRAIREQTDQCKNVLALLSQSDHTQAGSACKEKKHRKPGFFGPFYNKRRKQAVKWALEAPVALKALFLA